MFYSDYHMHTAFSSDSKTPMEEMIRASIQKGLKEIAFTDHVDFDYPHKDYPFLVEYSVYKKTVDVFREKYAGQIIIKCGVEIGLQPQIKEQVATLAAENDYDFIIGSTHCVERCDLYYGKLFQHRSKKEAFTRYFEDVLSNAKQFDEFHVYGHLDYVNRYIPSSDKTLDYNDYAHIIDEILRTIISKGKGIEINTSGFKYGLGHTHPQFPILKRYKDLGGEIVTVGGDAHAPEHIAAHFEDAYEMLQAAGFSYVTLFTKGQPEFLPLNKFRY